MVCGNRQQGAHSSSAGLCFQAAYLLTGAEAQIKPKTLKATLSYTETDEVENDVSIKELINDGHVAYSKHGLAADMHVACILLPNTCVAIVAGESRARWHKLAKNEVWVDGSQVAQDDAPAEPQGSDAVGSQEDQDAAISSSSNSGSSSSSSSSSSGSEVRIAACSKYWRVTAMKKDESKHGGLI